ncbi:MAG: glycoside hydrolase 43 family protein [Bacteroidaceae bacterium]|nr:glycoside hydrolase 43 family protein [Bacteroidaceae bacterium]
MTKRLIILLAALCAWRMAISQQPSWGQWTRWGQQPDGTYCNPVLPSDYSDLDCIRVGDDYYAISSTMQFSPGMTVLHSRDLVNWEIVGNAVTDLTQIGPALNWDVMNRYGRGVWAGSIRYHKDRFYIFFGTPDEGYFMTSAPDAAGPWDPLICLMADSGWDDCTAIWDDEGQGYFLGTCFRDNCKTYMFRMADDCRSIDLESARLVNEGNHREANKLIRHGKYYYLIFSEHKRHLGRYVMAKRDTCLTGDFKEEHQLLLPCREANEPNQGGIVEGTEGKWYFFTHHGTGDWSGRIASLLPVTWIDGWPMLGDLSAGMPGSMVWTGPMPKIEEERLTIARSDEFDTSTLAPQWQWNYQPRTSMFSLTERPGWIRLKAFRPLVPGQLLKAGNTLTQRSWRTSANCVTIKADVSNMADGQHAGLCHFSSTSSGIGIVQEKGARYLEQHIDGHYVKGERIEHLYIWLQTRWGLDGMATYYYSLDGCHFVPFGEPYRMVWGHYRGDRIGVYSFNDHTEEGWIDVDYLHYRGV